MLQVITWTNDNLVYASIYALPIPVLYLWLSKRLAYERRRYTCKFVECMHVPYRSGSTH